MGKIATWNYFVSKFSSLNTSDPTNKCPVVTDINVACNNSSQYDFQNQSGTDYNQCIQESNVDWEHGSLNWSGNVHNGNKTVCSKCRKCYDYLLTVCPTTAFYFEDGIPYIKESDCIACTQCYNMNNGFWTFCPELNTSDSIFWVDNMGTTTIIV